jgi:predicted Rossmann fold nucleotide-binding protein DprA/Smf involved in DNA uptake
MVYARQLQRPRFALPFAFDEALGRGSWDEVVGHGAEILVDERPVLRMLEEYGRFDNAKWWHYLCQQPSHDDGSADAAQASASSKSGGRPKRAARRRKKSGTSSRTALPPQQLAVVDAVVAGSKNAEQICATTGLSPQAVQHEILLLLLDGRLTEDSGGLLRYHSRPDE